MPTEMYFNGDCPVCRTEMTHYAKLCADSQPAFRFIDSMQRPDEFIECCLRREHLERRVYLREADGRILSGMPALVHLWSKMPEYHWLATVMVLPVLKPISTVVYDHVVAPGLALWATRRVLSRTPAEHSRS